MTWVTYMAAYAFIGQALFWFACRREDRRLACDPRNGLGFRRYGPLDMVLCISVWPLLLFIWLALSLRSRT